MDVSVYLSRAKLLQYWHMRIGLDFDGVISDCGTLKCEAALRLYGLSIPMERFKKELVVGGGLLTMEQYLALQDDIYGKWEIAQHAKPVPGVLEAVPELLRRGHEVRIITSRSGVTLEVARNWAKLHGLTLDITGVGHGVSKAEAAAGLDVFVDDDLDKLEPLVGVVPHRFLFSWPYNGHIDEGATAKRVASWAELMERVAIAASARKITA